MLEPLVGLVYCSIAEHARKFIRIQSSIFRVNILVIIISLAPLGLHLHECLRLLSYLLEMLTDNGIARVIL